MSTKRGVMTARTKRGMSCPAVYTGCQYRLDGTPQTQMLSTGQGLAACQAPCSHSSAGVRWLHDYMHNGVGETDVRVWVVTCIETSLGVTCIFPPMFKAPRARCATRSSLIAIYPPTLIFKQHPVCHTVSLTSARGYHLATYPKPLVLRIIVL